MSYKGSFGLGDPDGVTFENCRFSNEPPEPELKPTTADELFECCVAAFCAWFGTVTLGLVTGIGVSAIGEQSAGQASLDIVAKGFGYGILAGLPLAYEAFWLWRDRQKRQPKKSELGSWRVGWGQWEYDNRTQELRLHSPDRKTVTVIPREALYPFGHQRIEKAIGG